MFEYLGWIAILVCVNAIAGISLNLQSGTAGLVNFGQVAFVGLGGYAVAIVGHAGYNVWLGLLLGMALAAAAGYLLGRLGRTLGGVYWAIVTLAVAELLRLVISNTDGLTGGMWGIGNVAPLWGELHGTAETLATLGLALLFLGATVLVARHVDRSDLGRSLRLIRDNEPMAAAVGIDVVSAKSRALALAGAMAAAAGGFYAADISFVGPDQLLPFETFLVLTMIVVGGLGRIGGAIAGAVVVETVYNGTRYFDIFLGLADDQFAALRILLVGAILLGFLLVRPQGLVADRPRRVHV
ncbi:branched-chain amino acid ABC transporter permease [Nocardia crassostreae]|uniref:branched-chain amino acid ABC transporter permease n=1 Tax=Nocardia crassostreae TaxID=53428 RepID=UPI000833F9CA|nr:branched-chain amino acid ABC transporter permease [Nocardia crassostreae]